jgi:hypothetical protein
MLKWDLEVQMYVTYTITQISYRKGKDFMKIRNLLDQMFEEKKVVNLKVWIDDIVVYHSKIEQKATLVYEQVI